MGTGEKYVPVLGSNELLRCSGPIIAFRRGLGIFQAISNDVVKLERSSAGLLLLDFAKDLVAEQGVCGAEEREGLERLA